MNEKNSKPGYLVVKPQISFVLGELTFFAALSFGLFFIVNNYFKNSLFYYSYWDHENFFKIVAAVLGSLPLIMRSKPLLKYFSNTSYEFTARGIKICGILGLHENYTEMSKVLDWRADSFGLFSFIKIETKDLSDPIIIIPYLTVEDKNAVFEFLESRATSTILEHVQQQSFEKDKKNDTKRSIKINYMDDENND